MRPWEASRNFMRGFSAAWRKIRFNDAPNRIPTRAVSSPAVPLQHSCSTEDLDFVHIVSDVTEKGFLYFPLFNEPTDHFHFATLCGLALFVISSYSGNH